MKWKEENNCVSEEVLQQYIDGELEQKETTLIKEHILKCQNCQSAIKEKKLLIDKLNNALNLVDEDKIEVPAFDASKTNIIKFHPGKRIYRWSAAAIFILLISFFLIKNSQEPDVKLEYVFQEMNDEIDANKPWHEQTTTIYILNESGEIIDQIENL